MEIKKYKGEEIYAHESSKMDWGKSDEVEEKKVVNNHEYKVKEEPFISTFKGITIKKIDMPKPLLTEEQIKELKTKVKVVDYEVEGGKSLSDLYKQINRSPYETGLLLKFSYELFRNVSYPPLKRIMRNFSFLEKKGFFRDIETYSNMNLKDDLRIQYYINKNLIFIEDVLRIVFTNFVAEKKKGQHMSSILDKIKDIKDKK